MYIHVVFTKLFTFVCMSTSFTVFFFSFTPFWYTVTTRDASWETVSGNFWAALYWGKKLLDNKVQFMIWCTAIFLGFWLNDQYWVINKRGDVLKIIIWHLMSVIKQKTGFVHVLLPREFIFITLVCFVGRIWWIQLLIGVRNWWRSSPHSTAKCRASSSGITWKFNAPIVTIKNTCTVSMS